MLVTKSLKNFRLRFTKDELATQPKEETFLNVTLDIWRTLTTNWEQTRQRLETIPKLKMILSYP